MRPSDQEFNRLKVLKALRRAGPICRTDLARLTDLTGGTITEITSDLVKRALVVEQRVPSGKRGRPRVDLCINPQGGYALAAFITIDGMVMCQVVNLAGGCEFSYSEPLPDPLSLEWAKAIGALIDHALSASPVPRHLVRRVGVGLPALVDTERGLVHWLQTFAITPCPVAAIIESVVRIPVTIDNDTNLLARAEHWSSDGPSSDDFVLVNVGLGISTTHYSRGILQAGPYGVNSEWGHSKIVPENGRACGCGAAGCLVTYSSISGIVTAICEMEGRDTPAYLEMDDFFVDAIARADAGNAGIRAIIERGGRYLGIALANLINGLGPGRILLLTPEPLLPRDLSGTLFDALDRNVLPALRGTTTVEVRSFSEDLFREGSAALVLEQIYRFR